MNVALASSQKLWPALKSCTIKYVNQMRRCLGKNVSLKEERRKAVKRGVWMQ